MNGRQLSAIEIIKAPDVLIVQVEGKNRNPDWFHCVNFNYHTYLKIFLNMI
jgi:hypothetical protein